MANIGNFLYHTSPSSKMVFNAVKAGITGANLSQYKWGYLNECIKNCHKEITASKDTFEGFARTFSNQLESMGKNDFNNYLNFFNNAFNFGKVTGRLKSPSSIYPKLIRNQNVMGQKGITSIVPDLLGYKLITNGSAGDIEKATKTIEDIVNSGVLIPSHIRNLGNMPYFSPEQLERLNKKGFYIVPNVKNSHLNNTNIYFKNPYDLSTVELQITGNKTDKINLKEHPFFNFKTKGTALVDGKVDEKYQRIFSSMDEKELEIYDKYVNDCYNYVRKCELGSKKEPKPTLPKGFDLSLKLI